MAKSIVEGADAAKISKHLFMRRTFQDLCRATSVDDFVARAISGHATVEMQQHYSSVNGNEVRDGLAKVISLAGFRRAQKSSAGGDRDPIDESSTEPDAARVVMQNRSVVIDAERIDDADWMINGCADLRD